MKQSNSKKLPQFSSNQEFIEFFESNDMGKYENDLPEAYFDVDIKRKHYLVSVDGYLMKKLLQVAKERQVSVEMLLDTWLKEKLLQVG